MVGSTESQAGVSLWETSEATLTLGRLLPKTGVSDTTGQKHYPHHYVSSLTSKHLQRDNTECLGFPLSQEELEHSLHKCENISPNIPRGS